MELNINAIMTGYFNGMEFGELQQFDEMADDIIVLVAILVLR
jgi:hypothetical protein